MRKALPDDRLLYRLAIVEHVMHARLDAELSGMGLTITSYSILLLLRHLPGLSASEIARRTLVSQQAAARLTSRLVGIGYLEKTPDPMHGKMMQHKLTAAGRDALIAGDAVVEAWENKVSRRLGGEGRRRLLENLNTIENLFEG